jgi:hypothetical protein
MRRALRTGLAAAATMLIAAPTAAATETQCTGFLTGTFDNVVVPENSFCRVEDSVVHGDGTALRDSELFVDSSVIGGDVVGDEADRVDVIDNAFFARESVVGGSIELTGGGGPTGTAPVAIALICGTDLPRGNIEVSGFSPTDLGGSVVLIGGLFQCGTPDVGGLGGGNTLGAGSIEVKDNTITGQLTVGGLDSSNVLGAGSIEVKRNAMADGAHLFVEHNSVGGNLEVIQNTDASVFGPVITGNSGGGALECFDNSPPPFLGSGNSFPEEEGQCD